MSGLRISIELLNNKIAIIRIAGAFEGMEALEASENLKAKTLQAGTQEVWVDFTMIDYVDSAAIGVLIEIAKTAALKKIKVSLFGVNDNVKKVLLVTRIDKIIPFVSNV